MQFQYLVICATFCAIWTTLVTIFSKSSSIIITSTFEIGFAPTLRQFCAISIFGHLCHFCAIWTTLVTAFSKSLSMFIMSTLEVGFAPILRQFRAISIVCHLCQFLSHLDHFSDNIFKIFVHIHSQHIRNRSCTKFEIILCNFNIWSFVPLFEPFGPL